jgi:hypothetical protein
MQLPQERDQATYPVTLWYRTWFEAEAVPADLRVLIDGFSGPSYTLFVNGREIGDRGRRSSLDAEIKEVLVAPQVKPGRNCVAVRLTVNRRTDGMLDPLKIVGDFTLAGRTIVAPAGTITVGDWTKQGYPFYSGTGVYRCEFTLPKKYTDGRLFLNVECGEDVLELAVNGVPRGVCPWPPYRCDLTGALKEGVNLVELKVTNTLINLLEGVEHPSGVFAPPALEHFREFTIVLPQE